MCLIKIRMEVKIMSRRLVSIVLSLTLMTSVFFIIPTTVSAVDVSDTTVNSEAKADSKESKASSISVESSTEAPTEWATTDSAQMTVHKGDTVNYWVEVAIPSDSLDVAGWTVDMYYDNTVLAPNADFAGGYGFASGTKAVEYALGLSDVEVDFPGGNITQGTFKTTEGRVSITDANPSGLKFKGKTTKVVCIQLEAIASGATTLSYRMRDLVDTNLEVAYVEKPGYQAINGAEFALKYDVVCDHTEIPTEEPTDAPTEAPTSEPTDAPTEVPTEAPTEISTEAITEVPTEIPTKIPVIAHTYTVAGSDTLCGSNWEPTDSNNDMIEISDGLFQKVYTGVNAGGIEFKVVEDHSWDNSFGPEGNALGSANCVAEVLYDGATVTVTFDATTGLVTWEIEYADAPEVPTEEPTDAPTEVPTSEPTEVSTEEPTDAPTEVPTDEPTDAPTEVPTEELTDAPTEAPTDVATDKPTTPTAPTSSATAPTSATNATQASTKASSSSTTTTQTNQTTTGKVATGDASSIAMLLGVLMIAAGTVVSTRRKVSSK